MRPVSGPYDMTGRAAALVASELSDQAPDRAVGYHVSLVTARSTDGGMTPALSIHLIGDGTQVGQKVMTTLTCTDLCPPPEAFTDLVRRGLEQIDEHARVRVD